VKSAQEAISGKDLITGQKLNWWQRGLAGVGALPGVPNLGLMLGAGKALKAPVRGLSAAEDMLKKGADVEDIWQKTGWIQGKEGKWRFEIDDSKFGFAKTPKDYETYDLGDLVSHPDLFEQYPQLKKVQVNIDPSHPSGGSFSNGEIYIRADKSLPKLKETLIHEIQHAIQDMEGFAKGANTNFVFGPSPEVAKILRESEIPKLRKKVNSKSFFI
jgi:hypothetical protein